jgi:hypothetical protein
LEVTAELIAAFDSKLNYWVRYAMRKMRGLELEHRQDLRSCLTLRLINALRRAKEGAPRAQVAAFVDENMRGELFEWLRSDPFGTGKVSREQVPLGLIRSQIPVEEFKALRVEDRCFAEIESRLTLRSIKAIAERKYKLKPREWKALWMNQGEDQDCQVAAQALNVSPSRITQLKREALRKLCAAAGTAPPLRQRQAAA